MGLLDFFRSGPYPSPQGVTVEVLNRQISRVLGMTVEDLWRTQPALRSVITFRARNIAQLGLHTFQRVGETDRKRVRDNPAAALLRRPNASTTTYELLYDLVSNIDLYDSAYWAFGEDDSEAGWTLYSIPSAWVIGSGGGTYWEPDHYIVAPPAKPQITIQADQMMVFHGWTPESKTRGTSPVEALRQTLAEQISAQEYRNQVWARGGRVGTYITRPAGTNGKSWDPTARQRFTDSFRESFAGRGNSAGGVPVLEDGMTMSRIGFSAHDEEYIDSAKLAISTVASVYHVNPTMLGQNDSANFSNVREFRRMLYTETLGPLISQIEDRINTFLVPKLTDVTGIYVEFNIAEKLQGSFEEQAAVLSTSTGGPWMTRNEARSRNNLPAIEGGDELIVPLNVITGGQASPQDGGSATGKDAPVPAGLLAADGTVRPILQRAVKSHLVKRRADPKHVDVVAKVFSDFFARQAQVVKSALGSKDDAWWDEDRWTKELSEDLSKASVPISLAVARKALDDSGVDPDQYDEARTINYLKAVAQNTAGKVNTATKAQLDAALDDDEPSNAIDNVFDIATDSRSDQSGLTMTTAVAMFASVEAFKQVGGSQATKEWVVTSPRPRASHAALSGETVPIDDPFSNGANWPGDSSVLDADEVAGCTCDVNLTFS